MKRAESELKLALWDVDGFEGIGMSKNAAGIDCLKVFVDSKESPVVLTLGGVVKSLGKRRPELHFDSIPIEVIVSGKNVAHVLS